MMATAAAAANLPCLPQTWKANNPKGRHKVITWERKTKSPSLTACYCSLSETSPLFRAAKHTIDTYIKSGMVIGLGSGQASAMAIKYLGHQIRAGAFKHILGIPTSVVSASEAAKAGIPLGELGNSSQDRFLQIDFAFDDVDIIEERTLISVIGCQRLQGEESIIQEKLVLSMADQLVFMVTKNQYKRGLEGSVPVVIESLNWLETAEEIDDLFLGDAETVFRILCYLKFAPGKAVLFSKHGHLQIEAFTDADWASSLDDRRSTSRYCTLVGGNLFTWRRKK
ncbi:probable ribose-5-phosphate isomerase 4, chloroplastic isoform X3 [Gossypium raimondii]|uniref:probable ribose-5-phosphate isomerase 4, chloroplastic isoform X3 n=1 Tax=Gossypium raimondii TaxID=29730 RepID=UPI00227CF20E|nr:probable ribose-5-phosphate isomerase 4, chloroplastic isoform X3 [Gossypium raimondii]